MSQCWYCSKPGRPTDDGYKPMVCCEDHDPKK